MQNGVLQKGNIVKGNTLVHYFQCEPCKSDVFPATFFPLPCYLKSIYIFKNLLFNQLEHPLQTKYK